MGKRKSRTSKSMATSRKPPKLQTEFACPFCAHPEAVRCICSETYCTRAHALTVPVDVYADWIDACEIANEGVVVRSCRPRLVVG